MRLILIADTYPPLRTSGAVQMRDLSRAFVSLGHHVTVMVPDSTQEQPWTLRSEAGVEVLRLHGLKTKDTNYVKRTINEFLTPYLMLRNYQKSPLKNVVWDGVVWYSPMIFFGPLIGALRKKCGCRSYLILRDIFPQWAVDMGLMGRGLPYLFFKSVERFQYSVADVIGVQTPANQTYFDSKSKRIKGRVEVLHNWLAFGQDIKCSIRVTETPLAGRKLFVYAGNMGIAQGMDILIELAKRLLPQKNIGFLFVGRGSEARRLSEIAQAQGLDNILFYDEIDPDEIPGLYAQCHFGLVSLDPRHKTHNIPGKFLTYMQSGLPVLANINPGNDLSALIAEENVGRASVDGSVETLQRLALELVDSLGADTGVAERCKQLSARLFSPEAAVKQIVAALGV